MSTRKLILWSLVCGVLILVAGIEHGHCIVVDGVPHLDRNRLVFLNPAYTLLPQGDD